MRRTFGARVRRTAAAAVLAATTCGCAVNGTGALMAEVVQGDGGYLIQVHSLGAHLMTREDSRGLHIGYTRQTFVFADDESGPEPGLYVGWVPLPDRVSLANQVMTAGIHLDVTNGLATGIGYRARTVLARLPADSSETLELSLDFAALDALRVRHRCHGEGTCAGE